MDSPASKEMSIPTVEECMRNRKYSDLVGRMAEEVMRYTYEHPNSNEPDIALRCYYPLPWLPSCRAESIVAVISIMEKLGLVKDAAPVHEADCAVAINGRHDCSCGAEAESIDRVVANDGDFGEDEQGISVPVGTVNVPGSWIGKTVRITCIPKV